ncbi:DEAD-domain-containing protein [Basidiobolus meristosporus CBS 931.73]|uniref:RNA helicase n=1 Tax=Basidiobolus meristosporus CBS 931.73 TaxID=1314790 RepID=A0A1Y1W3D8_9FUNG|nr:DEAD-domain-containing protein [Basidiobolus meristosporus CBS 931.73]|eukprot:ORX68063.1 DEAD-domain-containing protein [Basidiobolus meristosporus CBS 931.73]
MPAITEESSKAQVNAVDKELKKAKKEKKSEKSGEKVKKEKKDKKEKKEKKDKKRDREEATDKKKAKKSKKAEPEAEPVVVAEAPLEGGIRKCFYQPHPEVEALPQSDIQAYYEKHGITMTTDQEYRPLQHFYQTGYSEDIMNFCKKFTTPTPIQSSCWPIVLSGRDVIGIAETGSGKTLAFTLPAVTHIKGQPGFGTKQSCRPTVLVLAPTRELVMQSQETAEEVGAACNISSVCIYGGVPKDQQKRALKSGAQFVVATPGRLLDLVEEGACDLSNVSFLVLDEADRMLDFGFEQAIRSIISKTNPHRQTVMFSATWPETIRKLANDFLVKPVKVTIGSDDLAVSHNVTQIVEVIDDPRQKERRLHELLQKYHKSRKNRVLVFVLYKKEAERVENYLMRQGWKVTGIHGDKNQSQRTEAISAFKDGSYPLLIATDVAARGLDIPNVEYVINVTFPLTIDEYVHRIGRTGRAGKKGTAHTLFTPHDKAHSGSLINVLKSANQPVPDSLFKFGTTVKKKEHKSYGAFFKEIDPNVKPTKIIFD